LLVGFFYCRISTLKKGRCIIKSVRGRRGNRSVGNWGPSIGGSRTLAVKGPMNGSSRPSLAILYRYYLPSQTKGAWRESPAFAWREEPRVLTHDLVSQLLNRSAHIGSSRKAYYDHRKPVVAKRNQIHIFGRVERILRGATSLFRWRYSHAIIIPSWVQGTAPGTYATLPQERCGTPLPTTDLRRS